VLRTCREQERPVVAVLMTLLQQRQPVTLELVASDDG